MRHGQEQYIVVNKFTGEIEDNCQVCGIFGGGSPSRPKGDSTHTVIPLTREELATMSEEEPTGGGRSRFKYKWNINNKKPEVR